MMNSVELFAGCGGLAFGVSKAGFKHNLVVEKDSHACLTMSMNKERKIIHVADWPIFHGDIRLVDYTHQTNDSIDLISGGPPCQPFSIGGSHKGPKDKRNMWPEAIRGVRDLRPKAFLFENVKGLLRPAFSRYLDFLTLQLSFPEIHQLNGESDYKFYCRLKAHNKNCISPTYKVLVHDINAADYGAAQKRNRALIIGVKNEFAENFTFPNKTHSREALVWAKFVSKKYWENHNAPKRSRDMISKADLGILKKLDKIGEPIEKPWITVRDIFKDLPDPNSKRSIFLNHDFHPGAKVYPGHTGSIFDEPAKALKAGAHGVPGGENILVNDKGQIRYFTVREMARLQGLPDDYLINGAWINSTKQLGNAVPVQIGHFFASQVHKIITRAY